jgi:hypothetical protein
LFYDGHFIITLQVLSTATVGVEELIKVVEGGDMTISKVLRCVEF